MSAEEGPGSSTLIAWTLDETAGVIRIGVGATTTGWVAIGFSNGMGMPDTDAVIGYIPGNDGLPIVEDAFIADQRTACKQISSL